MTYETNCLVIQSKPAWIVEILGEQYWNDTEDIRCIPIRLLEYNELKAIAEKLAFTMDSIQKFQYIILEGQD
jgi:hypothetical protein